LQVGRLIKKRRKEMKTYWLVLIIRVSDTIRSSIRLVVTDQDMLTIEPAIQTLMRGKLNPDFGITMVERTNDEAGNGKPPSQRKASQFIRRQRRDR
jgi:hypothetical protein